MSVEPSTREQTIPVENAAAAKATRKEERRKKKDATALLATSGATAMVEEPKPKKKKRKHVEETAEPVVIADDVPMAEDAKVAERPITPQKIKEPRTEKRKKGRTKNILSVAASVVEEDASEQPKKKKRRKTKSTTGFADPEEDPSLTDQARRALSYAFAQFDDIESWKFNKARQNWLLRNLWSEESIPEKHMPLLSKYVSNVQGGVRENLIKSCQNTLSPPPVLELAAPAEEAPSTGEIATAPPLKSALKPRAAAVAPAAILTPEDPVLLEFKKSRARVILETLGAPVSVE